MWTADQNKRIRCATQNSERLRSSWNPRQFLVINCVINPQMSSVTLELKLTAIDWSSRGAKVITYLVIIWYRELDFIDSENIGDKHHAGVQYKSNNTELSCSPVALSRLPSVKWRMTNNWPADATRSRFSRLVSSWIHAHCLVYILLQLVRLSTVHPLFSSQPKCTCTSRRRSNKNRTIDSRAPVVVVHWKSQWTDTTGTYTHTHRERKKNRYFVRAFFFSFFFLLDSRAFVALQIFFFSGSYYLINKNLCCVFRVFLSGQLFPPFTPVVLFLKKRSWRNKKQQFNLRWVMWWIITAWTCIWKKEPCFLCLSTVLIARVRQRATFKTIKENDQKGIEMEEEKDKEKSKGAGQTLPIDFKNN